MLSEYEERRQRLDSSLTSDDSKDVKVSSNLTKPSPPHEGRVMRAEQLLAEKRLAESYGVQPGEDYVVRGNRVFVVRGRKSRDVYELPSGRRVGRLRGSTLQVPICYPPALFQMAEAFGFTNLRLKAWGLDHVVHIADIEAARRAKAELKSRESSNRILVPTPPTVSKLDALENTARFQDAAKEVEPGYFDVGQLPGEEA